MHQHRFVVRAHLDLVTDALRRLEGARLSGTSEASTVVTLQAGTALAIALGDAEVQVTLLGPHHPADTVELARRVGELTGGATTHVIDVTPQAQTARTD